MAKDLWAEKWTIIRTLSENTGQGKTILVHRVGAPDQQGVLKLLNDDSNDQARHRMAHEAINLDSLSKKNVKVPKLLDHNTSQYNEPSVELYIVMELIHGKTLDKEVESRGGHLSLDKSFEIVGKLCETMSEMHHAEVLHRDIKPANLMVRDFDKADIVVLDLGLSYDREGKQTSVTRAGETIKNELVALSEATTPSGDRRDDRSDIANIVCLFFYCLTGHLPKYLLDERSRLPHQREGYQMQKVLAGDARARQVELLFDRGLAHDIEGRFQTMGELQERLALALKGTEPKKKSAAELAKELGSQIRKRNRGLQLQEMAQKIVDFNGRIAEYIGTLVNALDPFIVTRMGYYSTNRALPTGAELVNMQINPISVSIKGRTDQKAIDLCVAARGDQCVLLRSEVFNVVNGSRQPSKTWIEVDWFNSAQRPSDGELNTWIDDLVAMLMVEVDKSLN